mmetsp:Transcript_68546/g.108792  ORF Transcript_68546/g.108792 Transcript_68546/m.108792 type:complete len:213 (-) Transcript_68546:118-756(-)
MVKKRLHQKLLASLRLFDSSCRFTIISLICCLSSLTQLPGKECRACWRLLITSVFCLTMAGTPSCAASATSPPTVPVLFRPVLFPPVLLSPMASSISEFSFLKILMASVRASNAAAPPHCFCATLLLMSWSTVQRPRFTNISCSPLFFLFDVSSVTPSSSSIALSSFNNLRSWSPCESLCRSRRMSCESFGKTSRSMTVAESMLAPATTAAK